MKSQPQQVFDEEININITEGGTHNVKQEEFIRRKSVHFGSVQYLGKKQTNKGSSQRMVITNSSGVFSRLGLHK